MNFQNPNPSHFHRALAVLCGIWFCIANLATAQEQSAALTIRGTVKTALELKLADLQSMTRASVRARDGDSPEMTFEGVNLWDLVQKAKPADARGHKELVNTCVVVKARDGYQAVFALAELAPSMTDRKIILADRCDGKPLSDAQGPLRIIVPGEKMHARWVRQVTALEVVSLLADKSKLRLPDAFCHLIDLPSRPIAPS